MLLKVSESLDDRGQDLPNDNREKAPPIDDANDAVGIDDIDSEVILIHQQGTKGSSY